MSTGTLGHGKKTAGKRRKTARRTPRGTFAPGTAPGPGRPKNTVSGAELRKTFREVAGPEVGQIAAALASEAKKGSVPAAREVLDRVLGSPVPGDDPPVTSGDNPGFACDILDSEGKPRGLVFRCPPSVTLAELRAGADRELEAAGYPGGLRWRPGDPVTRPDDSTPAPTEPNNPGQRPEGK